MSNDDTFGFELSEESLRHVEAGAAAHRAALEINRAQRDQLEHLKVELAKANTENDHLRLANHDLTEKLAAVEEAWHDETVNRAEYWNTIQAVAALILNVKQRVDPAERQEGRLEPAQVPQDARNGDGGAVPRAFIPARHRLALPPENPE